MIKIFYKDRKQRHFRGKKTRVNGKIKIHPHYIVGENESKYASLGITHDKYKGRKHPNYELKSNPKKDDNSIAYLRKQIEVSPKKLYTIYRYNDYKMSTKDDDYVDQLVEKKKNYKSKK